jgi:hypothetical protein
LAQPFSVDINNSISGLCDPSVAAPYLPFLGSNYVGAHGKFFCTSFLEILPILICRQLLPHMDVGATLRTLTNEMMMVTTASKKVTKMVTIPTLKEMVIGTPT